MSPGTIVIWTQEARKELYTSVLHVFGPQNSWDVPGHPGDSKDYALFCENYALRFTRKLGRVITSGAVAMQLRWALTLQTNQVASTHVRSYILCKAAALEVGLINRSGLPHTLCINNKDTNK